jgi:hypothetical protein
VIKALFQERPEYLFSDFKQAFWEMMKTYYETEQIADQEDFFYSATKKELLIEIGRKDVSVSALDKQEISSEPTKRAK